ncbi:unnamed protein product, partial [Rotaria socialis]
ELQEINFSPGNDEVFQPVPLAIDTDGFIMTFSVEQEEEIFKFFE